MALPDSYTLKPGSIPAYFDAMVSAQPPERFSLKFLENLGFTSTNDRLFVGILKDLGFLNRDGAPQSRYFSFLDKSQSKKILAEGIREAFADLFAINTKANEYTTKDTTNKLRSLYAGKKTDLVISNIAKTFKALSAYADFSDLPTAKSPTVPDLPATPTETGENASSPINEKFTVSNQSSGGVKAIGLQYHINIVLPETRDQSVYDAIFKALREHL